MVMMDNRRRVDEATEIHQLKNLNIKLMATAEDYAVILTANDKLFWWGEKVHKIILSIYKKQELEKPKGSIRKIKASKSNVVLLMDDELIYYIGSNIYTNGEKGEYIDKFTKLTLHDSQYTLSYFDVGYKHFVYTTTCNKFFAYGAEYLDTFDVLDRPWREYAEIPLGNILENENNIEQITPICSQSDDISETVTYLLVKIKDKNKLYSQGESKTGKLGQGKKVTKSNRFQLMDYDSAEVNFVDVSAPYDFGMALTKTRELYAWGENKNDIFGFGDKIIYSPRKIELLKDFKVIDFS